MHVVYLTATTIVIFVFYVLTDEGEENKIGINFFTRIRVTLKPIDSTMNTKKGLREGGGRKRGESGVIPSTDISTFSTLTHQWALPRSFSTQSSEPPRFIPSFNPLARTQCFATLARAFESVSKFRILEIPILKLLSSDNDAALSPANSLYQFSSLDEDSFSISFARIESFLI